MSFCFSGLSGFSSRSRVASPSRSRARVCRVMECVTLFLSPSLPPSSPLLSQFYLSDFDDGCVSFLVDRENPVFICRPRSRIYKAMEWIMMRKPPVSNVLCY
ncbi:hypothetical protein DCAR_0933617 [Daucus carota subsp. sativus]|uniref:Uncharacterized protein n=1 Tax=Daucus carota subsp. sativus TaxID=79200 RepID=A0AAF0XX67_DAUCS|nr:PREDICTED: uncharacterized protein LOC108201834 [Daucus carota subsp. sativus]WOH14101.1 hypothetical protein DCAR_0933617 [Daucus carota subsp. sativus]